ncbi:MAG: hypothetical protein JWN03_4099 [Nocardia sp.]|nr:hypothetical protein [Nocardia sp.]
MLPPMGGRPTAIDQDSWSASSISVRVQFEFAPENVPTRSPRLPGGTHSAEVHTFGEEHGILRVRLGLPCQSHCHLNPRLKVQFRQDTRDV